MLNLQFVFALMSGCSDYQHINLSQRVNILWRSSIPGEPTPRSVKVEKAMSLSVSFTEKKFPFYWFEFLEIPHDFY